MTKPVVTVTRRLPDAVEQRLADAYDVRLNATDVPLDERALLAAMAASDGIVSTLGDPFTADVIRAQPRRTRIIAHFGVGYDTIDAAAARDTGLVVTNTPGVLTDDTADLTMLLILAAARRATEGERELRAAAWTGWRPTHLLGTRVSGKTLGLVGFGRIARAVARRARDGFGMSVLAWSRSLDAAEAEAAGVSQCNTLEELLGRADFVSLHVPSTPDTRHLLNAARLALIRPTAFLVNTARGDVVEERALVAALAGNGLAGAGLDVFDREPRVSPALLALPNVFALPHLGSATVETRTAMGMRAVANLDAFFRGDAPPDRVA